jgi:hypothetical protein
MADESKRTIAKETAFEAGIDTRGMNTAEMVSAVVNAPTSAFVSQEQMQKFVNTFVDESRSKRSGSVSGGGVISTSVSKAADEGKPASQQLPSVPSIPPAPPPASALTSGSVEHLIPMLAWKNGQLGVVSLMARFHFKPF